MNATNALFSVFLLFLFASLIAAQSETAKSDKFVIESAVLQVVSTIEIPAKASGPLSEVNIEQGALVDTEQVLATINDDDARIRLEEAKIELDIVDAQVNSTVDIEFAKKSRQVAIADFRRAQESNRSYPGVVSDREMDRLKLLVEQSDAELAKIQFEKLIMQKQRLLKNAVVKKNEIEVERHMIRSAIAGQVVELRKRAGEWVNIADPVLKVVRIDKLRIEEYLPAKIALRKLIGASASFESSGTHEIINTINGRVVFVSPNIDPLNSTVRVWIEFDNPKLALRPGTKGKVVIQMQLAPEERPAEKQPSSAN